VSAHNDQLGVLLFFKENFLVHCEYSRTSISCGSGVLLFSVRRQDPETCEARGLKKCLNSDECIEERWICDGRNHCDDGSDESDCREFLGIPHLRVIVRSKPH
jgi:Low-density lipoprotein receptor domain class A